MQLRAALVLLPFAAAFGGTAGAQTVNVNLGPSAENFTLFGQGPTQPGSGLGTFTMAQGASAYDAASDTSTFTLSGLITGGSAGFSSGTYRFLTSYSGQPGPMGGPNSPLAQSNPSNINYFYYDAFDSSTNITLFLQTPGGSYQEALVTLGQFVAGTNFSFLFQTPTCTGVSTCTQNNVGLTPGATLSGPVTTAASFQIITPVTPPAPGAVPEPASWAMMIVGFAMIGAGLRYRRRRTVFRYA